MNLAASKQDNRVSESCEFLKHSTCHGTYRNAVSHGFSICRCACHTFIEARPQLVKLINEIDNYLGAAEPSKAQREQGGDGNPRQDFNSPATSADVTGSLCDSTGQHQASPSEDRAEGSASTTPPEKTDPAGTRSPAILRVQSCSLCGVLRIAVGLNRCRCGGFLGPAFAIQRLECIDA